MPSQNLRILCPKTTFFAPKRPRKSVKTGKQRERMATLHLYLDCSVTKSPLLPSNSTICPRSSPKVAKNRPECAHLMSDSPKTKHGPYLGLRGSNRNSEGTKSTRNPPLFVVSQPHNWPKRRLDPYISGHLVELEGSLAPARCGPTVGPLGFTRRKNDFFQSCSWATWNAQTSVFCPF